MKSLKTLATLAAFSLATLTTNVNASVPDKTKAKPINPIGTVYKTDFDYFKNQMHSITETIVYIGWKERKSSYWDSKNKELTYFNYPEKGIDLKLSEDEKGEIIYQIMYKQGIAPESIQISDKDLEEFTQEYKNKREQSIKDKKELEEQKKKYEEFVKKVKEEQKKEKNDRHKQNSD